MKRRTLLVAIVVLICFGVATALLIHLAGSIDLRGLHGA